jgi:hypothetical protein
MCSAVSSLFTRWRGLIYTHKGARTAAASTPMRPRRAPSKAKPCGPHRSRRHPTPLPGLRCGTRLARRASPPVVRCRSTSLHVTFDCAFWAGITTRCLSFFVFKAEEACIQHGPRTAAASPPPWDRATGSDEPSGPRRRKQGRGPHRSRRHPTAHALAWAAL